MTVDVMEVRRDLGDLDNRVTTLEQTNATRDGEVDAHRHKLLELRDKKEELQYHLEDLENRLCRSNIRIKDVPLQVVSRKLEDYVIRLLRHAALDLAHRDTVLVHTHRVGLLA
ncbi:hypothetical protein NDU88_001372 [Pleurodeles waltl]|uniref:Uncharacterized protein n=1 Tax=Pleurodeles waltl TaxID=8319 RepID=A0AAV7NEZ0_PLEWA|nr:hypothetical protein NDU88_001372 [Pleurodeles waltl]